MEEIQVNQFLVRGKVYRQSDLPLEKYACIPGTKEPTVELLWWRMAKKEAVRERRPMAFLSTYRRGKEPKKRQLSIRHTDVYRGAAKYHINLRNANDDFDAKCMMDPVIAAGRNGNPPLPKSQITPQYGTSLDPRGLYDVGVLSTYTTELLGV